MLRRPSSAASRLAAMSREERVMKTMMKMTLAVFLALVWMWFALSFKWSYQDMSMAEKVVGIVYMLTMVPIYCGIKAFGRSLSESLI